MARPMGNIRKNSGQRRHASLLEQLHVAENDIDRVCYLVGHHHTYSHIDGLDYQILVEADFLVNLYEDQISEHGVDSALGHIFKTKTGTQLCQLMYKEKYSKEENNQ